MSKTKDGVVKKSVLQEFFTKALDLLRAKKVNSDLESKIWYITLKRENPGTYSYIIEVKGFSKSNPAYILDSTIYMSDPLISLSQRGYINIKKWEIYDQGFSLVLAITLDNNVSSLICNAYDFLASANKNAVISVSITGDSISSYKINPDPVKLLLIPIYYDEDDVPYYPEDLFAWAKEALDKFTDIENQIATSWDIMEGNDVIAHGTLEGNTAIIKKIPRYTTEQTQNGVTIDEYGNTSFADTIEDMNYIIDSSHIAQATKDEAGIIKVNGINSADRKYLQVDEDGYAYFNQADLNTIIDGVSAQVDTLENYAELENSIVQYTGETNDFATLNYFYKYAKTPNESATAVTDNIDAVAFTEYANTALKSKGIAKETSLTATYNEDSDEVVISSPYVSNLATISASEATFVEDDGYYVAGYKIKDADGEILEDLTPATVRYPVDTYAWQEVKVQDTSDIEARLDALENHSFIVCDKAENTPIGVTPSSADFVGTLSAEDADKLSVYLVKTARIEGISTASGDVDSYTEYIVIDKDGVKEWEILGNTKLDLSGYLKTNTAVTHTENTDVGSANRPVYITSNGSASAILYEVNKTVPADAVFTDTTYTQGDNITINNNVISATVPTKLSDLTNDSDFISTSSLITNGYSLYGIGDYKIDELTWKNNENMESRLVHYGSSVDLEYDNLTSLSISAGNARLTVNSSFDFTDTVIRRLNNLFYSDYDSSGNWYWNNNVFTVNTSGASAGNGLELLNGGIGLPLTPIVESGEVISSISLMPASNVIQLYVADHTTSDRDSYVYVENGNVTLHATDINSESANLLLYRGAVQISVGTSSNAASVTLDRSGITKLNNFLTSSDPVTAEVNGVETQLGTPIGAIMLWANNSAPSGWVFCDGRSLDSDEEGVPTEYYNLYNVIGLQYTPDEDGSLATGVFNVPNLEGPATGIKYIIKYK